MNLKSLRRGLVNYALVGAVRLAGILPFGLVCGIFRGSAFLIYSLVPKVRKSVLANLELAFGSEQSPRERRRFARRVFRHLAVTGAEFLQFTRGDRFFRSIEVNWEGREILDEAVENGKGCVFVTAHAGNWELMGALLARAGYPVNVVARFAKESQVEEVLGRIRAAGGVRVLHRGLGTLRMMRVLRAGKGLGILGDLDTRAGEAIYVPFFGRPAYTQTGPARLAARSGAPLVVGLTARIGPNSHTVHAEGPWFVSEDPASAPGTISVEDAVRLYTSRIEDWIRRYPEQWIWTHRRWRRTPERMRRRGK